MRSHAQLYPNADQAETEIQGFLPPPPPPCPAISSERYLGLPGKQVALPRNLDFSSHHPVITLVSRSQADARLRAGRALAFFPSPLLISL